MTDVLLWWQHVVSSRNQGAQPDVARLQDDWRLHGSVVEVVEEAEEVLVLAWSIVPNQT